MDVLLGLVFSFLWASASTAAKYSFQGQPPLTILSVRFAIAGALMMAWHYGLRRDGALPRGRQWGQLAIVGLTNSTLFLGAAWLGLREVPVGLYSLFLATMPFQVALLSQVWLGRQVTRREWLGIAVAAIGLAIAAAPSLARSTATWFGLVSAAVAMVSQAVGAVYFKRAALAMPSGVINAWQLALGLCFLLPFAAALDGGAGLRPTPQVISGLAWSIFMVSVVANALLFTMQKRDPFWASTWLLLAPVFSYLQAALVLGEPIGLPDLIGSALVVAGLVISGATKGARAEANKGVEAQESERVG